MYVLYILTDHYNQERLRQYTGSESFDSILEDYATFYYLHQYKYLETVPKVQ